MRMEHVTGTNPILYTDYPDPDVIRVGDTYYMVSTTMHFMPGGVILRSYDLIHWEIASYVYETLDDTPGQRLTDGKGIYGKGMWAASLRYHKGTFYVCFVANDTGKTYLYTAKEIEGPWEKRFIEGFYHDNSLLFDDDDRVYIAYGNREIYITELNETLTAPKEGGLHRMAVKDTGDVILGYEGAHFYKINGKYYLFFIHWPRNGLRTQACFYADSLQGEFIGGDVLSSDLDGIHSGVAQGGIVDTPEGDWYSVMFQDHGAVGRIPVLVPVTWENVFPVFGTDGTAPKQVTVSAEKTGYEYEPLWYDDDFMYTPDRDGSVKLKKPWQWNHTPDNSLWSVTEQPGTLRIRSGKLSTNLVQAVNTLTQRTIGPECAAEVTLCGKELKDGDYAGLCALQGAYGFIGLTRENGQLSMVVMKSTETGQPAWMGSVDAEPGTEVARIPAEGETITLRLTCDFTDGRDTAEFFFRTEGAEQTAFTKLGEPHKLHFRLDHFVGCRFGLFLFSTKETGGTAEFSKFRYFTDVK